MPFRQDMELPGWRQSSNMFYLLGKFDLENVYILVNASCSPLCVSLILPEQAFRDTVFKGGVPDKAVLKQRHNLKDVYEMDEIPVRKGSVLNSPFLDPGHLEGYNIKYSVIAEQAFLEARWIKTQPELILLGYASRVAFLTHQKIEKAIRKFSDISESKLASLFVYLSNVCSCELQAYNPIVGAAEHSAILHFPTGLTPDGGFRHIKSHNFVLIDAAPAYKGYASDLTRTYIRKKTAKHQLLSKIVLNSQIAGLKSFKENNTWSKVVDQVLTELTHGLWRHNFLIAKDFDTLWRSGVISIFMPHGVGHPVGLDVHDPHPASVFKTYNHSLNGLRDEYPLKLRYDYILEKGMVHTIEPGVYFIPFLLKKAKNESMGISHLINWDLVDQWHDVGGIRIEDVIAIDHDGVSRIITDP